MLYLDTNILIYLLEGHPKYGPAVVKILEQAAADGQALSTSALTITEFLAGTKSTNAAVLDQIPRLTFVLVSEEIAKRAGLLQQNHSSLKIGDALHLATALQGKAKLFVTNDALLAKVAQHYMTTQSL